MPLETKKNGIRKPNPTAVSFDSNCCELAPAERRADDHPGEEPAEQDVEPELAGEQDEPEDEHHRDPHSELARRLDRPLERLHAAPGPAHRAEGEDEGQDHERAQDQCLVERLRRREDERDQEDRAELAERPGGEQVAAEPGVELPLVAEDRDQGPDRGRRERRAGVEVARRRRRLPRARRRSRRRAPARPPSRSPRGSAACP